MTEKVLTIEGVVHKVNKWAGNADMVWVWLFDDQLCQAQDKLYFCHKSKLKVPKGKMGWFKIVKGKGDLKEYYRILNSGKVRTDYEMGRTVKMSEENGKKKANIPGQKAIQMPMDLMKFLLDERQAINVSRVKALEIAADLTVRKKSYSQEDLNKLFDLADELDDWIEPA